MEKTAAPWRVLDDADSVGKEPGGAEAPAPAGWLTPRLLAGVAAAVGLAIAAFLVAATGPSGSVAIDGGSTFSSDGPVAGSSAGAVGGEIVVDVQGAVVNPGIQRLVPGSRVGDAIASAGGFTPRVDAARAAAELNLATVVSDGDRIVVPARGDPPPAGGGSGAGGSGAGGGGLVNVNTASASELDALPGVGPVTAQKIIDARAEKPFATVDELKERKVLGAAAFDKLRDLVTVR
ncbi:MAG TPA: ComEA family DNA-binding protein [Candidatus Limnocylindrales bacterium]|nr:ComEA family DNA-binding protein [Candidatus Limnocylindrales bacterium]